MKIQSILQHECQTRATPVRHKCGTSATRTTRVQHECYTIDTSATRVKNFDFHNGRSENIFSHPYIIYIANKIFQGEEQLHSKNYLLEMLRSHAKMNLESVPQKLNFVMAKAKIKKLHTRLQLEVVLHVPAQLRIVTQPCFR